MIVCFTMWKVIDWRDIENIEQNRTESIRLIYYDHNYVPPLDPERNRHRGMPGVGTHHMQLHITAVLARNVAKALQTNTSVTSVEMPDRGMFKNLHSSDTKEEENNSYLALFDAVIDNQ